MDLREMRTLVEDCGCGSCEGCKGEDDKKPMKPMKVKIKNGFMQMAKKGESVAAEMRALADSKAAHSEDDDVSIVRACLAAAEKIAAYKKLPASEQKDAWKEIEDTLNSVRSIELGNQSGPKRFGGADGTMRLIKQTIQFHAKDAGLTSTHYPRIESVEDAVKRATAVSKFRDELEGAGLRFSFMNGVSIRGKTYPVKDVLTKYGFKFSGKGNDATWSRKDMKDLDFHDFYADLTKAMKQGKSEQPKVKKEAAMEKYVVKGSLGVYKTEAPSAQMAAEDYMHNGPGKKAEKGATVKISVTGGDLARAAKFTGVVSSSGFPSVVAGDAKIKKESLDDLRALL